MASTEMGSMEGAEVKKKKYLREQNRYGEIYYRKFMASASINAVCCLPLCRILLLFFCFLWSSTQDSVSQQAPLIPIFRSLVWAPVQQPWMNWVYLKGRLTMNKDSRAREKDEAKTKVSDQGSKFNFQLCIYIGETQRSILCFSWILLQNKLFRSSAAGRSQVSGLRSMAGRCK